MYGLEKIWPFKLFFGKDESSRFKRSIIDGEQATYDFIANSTDREYVRSLLDFQLVISAIKSQSVTTRQMETILRSSKKFDSREMVELLTQVIRSNRSDLIPAFVNSFDKEKKSQTMILGVLINIAVLSGNRGFYDEVDKYLRDFLKRNKTSPDFMESDSIAAIAGFDTVISFASQASEDFLKYVALRSIGGDFTEEQFKQILQQSPHYKDKDPIEMMNLFVAREMALANYSDKFDLAFPVLASQFRIMSKFMTDERFQEAFSEYSADGGFERLKRAAEDLGNIGYGRGIDVKLKDGNFAIFLAPVFEHV